MINEAATTFATVGFGLLIAHQVADHWVQTGYQAAHKGLPGWPGRIACATHVATYTATTAATVALLWATLSLDISPPGVRGRPGGVGTHPLLGGPSIHARSALRTAGQGRLLPAGNTAPWAATTICRWEREHTRSTSRGIGYGWVSPHS